MLRTAWIDATGKISELHHQIPDAQLSTWYLQTLSRAGCTYEATAATSCSERRV